MKIKFYLISHAIVYPSWNEKYHLRVFSACWNQSFSQTYRLSLGTFSILLSTDILIYVYNTLGGMVNFTLPFTTNEMISISTSQIFCSWLVIYHLRRPMAFLSLNLYDMPGLAPHMNVLFRGPGDFPVSYSKKDTSWNAWNRHSESFMVLNCLIQQYEFPLKNVNDIRTLDQQWLSKRSDFHQFYDLDTELDLRRITRCFLGDFETDVSC